MNRSNPPWKVAIVGPGRQGLRYGKALLIHDQFEIAGIVGRNQEKAEAAAKMFGVPCGRSLTDIVNSTPIDAICIATPDAVHHSYALEAHALGLAVLVEKPMAGTLADAEEMTKAFAEDSALVVTHSLLFDAALLKGLYAVRAGRIGDIMEVTIADYSTPFPDASHVQNVYQWLIHLFSVVAALSPKTNNIDIKGTLSTGAQFQGKLPVPFSLEWQDNDDSQALSVMLEGEKGALRWTRERGPSILEFSQKSGPWQQVPVERRDPNQLLLDHFNRIIQGQELPWCGPQQGFLAMKLAAGALAPWWGGPR